MLNRLTRIAVLTVALLFAGCDGAEGPVGPRGDVGPRGPEGSEGPRGPTGPAGDDGVHCWDLNENGENDPEEDVNGDGEYDVEDCRGGVSSIATLTLDFVTDDAIINGPVASVQYDVPEITPGVVDDGAVLGFFREQGTWTAMPYTFGEESPELPAVDYTITLGYGYDDQFLEVFYEASTSEVDLRNQPDRVIRVVIIEGFASAKSGLDLTNYEAVARYYGLQ